MNTRVILRITLIRLCCLVAIPLSGCDRSGGKDASAQSDAKPVSPPPAVLAATPSPVAPVAIYRQGPRQVAIFVKNRSGSDFEPKVMALEDLVSSRVTNDGFSVISREDVVNAVKSFAKDGANAGDDMLPGADLDKLLSNNTSALRLAQMMGADYLFPVSITTYGQSKRAFKGNGVETLVVEYKLRVSYKILDGSTGGSVAGDVVEVSKQDRVDENFAGSDDDINDLLDQAAVKLAEGLKEKALPVTPTPTQLASFSIACGMVDMTVPNVGYDKDHEVVVEQPACPIISTNVTVELDGVAIGTAPNTFSAPKGLHKIRLSREGCRDWERTISVMDGQALKVDLQMSDEGYARWKDTTAFLQELKTGTKLTDAQVKVLEGQAQMLRQSGYKVDIGIHGGTGLLSLWPLLNQIQQPK